MGPGTPLIVAPRRWPALWLAARSVLWTILMPGVVAWYVPWRYLGLRDVQVDLARTNHVLGLLLVVPGAILLVACIYEFARRGRGTLSPVDPPRRLVVQGLYCYVRNPMYLSVTTVVLGEAILAASFVIVVYWVIWFAGAHLFVIAYEEPNLRRRFGPSYDAYARRVGRWVPRKWSA
jgi:protein-S-isoprenylcysteine O-methyltransferase Ste14